MITHIHKGILYKSFMKTFSKFKTNFLVDSYYNFLSTDKAAIIRNAIPAHHRLPVRNQTTKATRAAGINMKIKRITKMIIKPIIIKPISPKRSMPSKLNHQCYFINYT